MHAKVEPRENLAILARISHLLYFAPPHVVAYASTMLASCASSSDSTCLKHVLAYLESALYP